MLTEISKQKNTSVELQVTIASYSRISCHVPNSMKPHTLTRTARSCCLSTFLSEYDISLQNQIRPNCAHIGFKSNSVCSCNRESVTSEHL